MNRLIFFLLLTVSAYSQDRLQPVYVGGCHGDTLFHGMVVEGDPCSTSDTVKVVRASQSTQFALGIVYHPWCDTCGLVSGSPIYIQTTGICEALIVPEDSATTYGNQWCEANTTASFAERGGFVRVLSPTGVIESAANHDKEIGHCLTGYWRRRNVAADAGSTYRSVMTGKTWIRYYAKLSIHFR